MRKILIRLAFGLALAVAALSQQTGAPVGIVNFPNQTPTRFLEYTGNNLIYLCLAPSTNQTSTASNYTYSLSVTAATLTNIVVLTNVGTVTTATAHGLMVGQTTTVSGSTTAALNGAYVIATVPSTTTFTIATSAVGDATYNNNAMTLSGEAPLLTKPIWSIAHFTYDTSNNLTGTQCALGSCSALTNKCSDRATITYK